ncbi:hypothetical protein BHM03_00039272 [Ensete ventricosum]|nr:hypothetical protein BHM03_00039272 [Ensete ventricosum]
MIRVTGELDYSSAYIRLREPDKSEDEAEALNKFSDPLRKLMKIIVVKSSQSTITTIESRLSASFPNIMPIDSGSDANLLGSDNFYFDFRCAYDAPAEVSQQWYQSQGSKEEGRPAPMQGRPPTARPRPRPPARGWLAVARANPQGRPTLLVGVTARRGDSHPRAHPLAT